MYRTTSEAEGVVVSLGSHEANFRDTVDHVSVGVMFEGEAYSGAAKNLHDAVALARRNFSIEKERRLKAAKEQRELKKRELTPHDRVHAAANG